jgi:hypothetical protein
MDYNITNKRIFVRGLCVECPQGTPLESCLLSSLRNLPLSEFRKIINAFDETRLDAILAHHNACIDRVKSRPD